MDLAQQIAELEVEDDLHEARLLVLIRALCAQQGDAIEGLTKLAKLDFLLRYPALLERALVARNKSPTQVETTDAERSSVESQMVRYRFGPWDHRYRRWLNDLAAKGLVLVTAKGKTVTVEMTASGREIADALAQTDEFRQTSKRSHILRQHFNFRARALMQFIYATFPEITTMRMNEKI